jgi:hypothetical protein
MRITRSERGEKDKSHKTKVGAVEASVRRLTIYQAIFLIDYLSNKRLNI